jgi:glycosyltransferase involved in cell wall biosynthesis
MKESRLKLVVDLNETGVIIPALNAEKTISSVANELLQMGFVKDNIIVIDDGSQDRTIEVIENLGLSVLRHDKNMGKGAALKHGFAAAQKRKLKKVFTLDADRQHDVGDISEFLKCCNLYDLIIGQRNYIETMPFLRRLVNKTTSLVVSLLAKKYIPDVQCGFRYIDLKIFDKVTLKTNNYETESEMVYKGIRNKYRIGFIPISTLYNNEKSYINPFVDTVRFIKMAIGFLWR